MRAQGRGFRRCGGLLQALAEAGDDEALRIEVEEGLAWCVHSTDGAAAHGRARTALARAEALGDPSALAGALSHLAFLESLTGEGVALERIERAVALGAGARAGRSARPARLDPRAPALLGRAAARARDHFDALHAEAAERGDEHSLPFILFQVARGELLFGDWAAARAPRCRVRAT